jgi:hypothetical protein
MRKPPRRTPPVRRWLRKNPRAAAAVNEPSAYNVPYVATTDTVSMNMASDTTPGGTIKKGETVWLKSDAAKSGLVPARTADGQIIQVRASDFKAK